MNTSPEMPHTALNVRNDPPVRLLHRAAGGPVHNNLTCTPLSVPHMVPAGHAVRWSWTICLKKRDRRDNDSRQRQQHDTPQTPISLWPALIDVNATPSDETTMW